MTVMLQNLNKESISVIIVSYNVKEHLSSCLESLRQSSGQEETFKTGIGQVVVVDNASTDGTLEMLGKYPWVEVAANDFNSGFGQAVNQGAALAKGKWLLILNPDSVVIGQGPGIMAEYLCAHPETGILGCRILDAGYAVQESARGFPNLTTPFFGRTSAWSRIIPMNPISRRNMPRVNEAREPMTVDWVSGACMMISRDLFLENQGFHSDFFMYWEDADLCLRLGRAGFDTRYFPGATVLHMTGRSSAKVPFRSTMHFYRSAFLYYRRNMRPVSAVPALAMDLVAALGTLVMGSFAILRNVIKYCRQSL